MDRTSEYFSMLLRRLAMPVGIGGTVHLTRSGHPNSLGSLTLVRFDVLNGRVEWEMRTHDGGTVCGNAISKIQNPYLPGDCWIKPSIPIRLHLRNGGPSIAPEMLFQVPGSVQLNVAR